MLPAWAYAVGATLAGLQLLVLWYVYRRTRRMGEGTVVDDADATGSVRCPNCDARNDPAYRFCRDCVQELPGATASDRSPSFPRGRGSP